MTVEMPDPPGRPEISVVVCTRNRAASLDRTLDALAAQLCAPPFAWEVVVVDNGSTDATPSVISAWATRFPAIFRQTAVATPGLAIARNHGIAVARAEILAFTDDDVRPTPDWVASIRRAMTDSAVDIVGGRILPDWGAPPPAWLLENEKLLGELALLPHEDRGLVDYTTRRRVWGANMAVRRAVFRQIGVFEPSLGRVDRRLTTGEDTELVKRACAAGKVVLFDPALVVFHRIGPDRLTRRYFCRRAFERGRQVAALSASASPPRRRAVVGAARALLGLARQGLGALRQGPWRVEVQMALAHGLGVAFGRAVVATDPVQRATRRGVGRAAPPIRQQP